MGKDIEPNKPTAKIVHQDKKNDGGVSVSLASTDPRIGPPVDETGTNVFISESTELTGQIEKMAQEKGISVKRAREQYWSSYIEAMLG